MKFIRDIISEKRSLKSANMPPPSPLPNSTDGHFEDLTLAGRLDDKPDSTSHGSDLSDHRAGIERPDDVTTQMDGGGGTGPLSDYEMNILANGDTSPNESINQRQREANTRRAEIQNQEEAQTADTAASRYSGMSERDVPNIGDGKFHLNVGSLRGSKPSSLLDQSTDHEGLRHAAQVNPPSGQQLHPATDDVLMGFSIMKEEEDADAHQSAPFASKPVAETIDRIAGYGEMPFGSALQTGRPDDSAPDAAIQVPAPAAGRGSNRSVRVKTRLLGFNPEGQGLSSPFEKEMSRANDAFPVGWLIVVAGPGRGASFPLHDGVARIGRGEDQTVSLNFGDNSISRENHVSVAFDAELNAFFIGQSGRSNIVRLNNKPLLSTEQVRTGDQIRVGETTLRLVALCGEGFSWATNH